MRGKTEFEEPGEYGADSGGIHPIPLRHYDISSARGRFPSRALRPQSVNVPGIANLKGRGLEMTRHPGHHLEPISVAPWHAK